MRSSMTIAFGLSFLLIAYVYFRQPRAAPSIVVTSAGPTVQRLERLSQLVTNRVTISDVLVGVSDDSKGVFVIRGDAIVGLDLSKAVIVEKDEASKRATILLPQPKVIVARVDHEKSKVYEFRTTTWIPWHAQPGRLLEQAMLQAQRMVEQAANSAENIELARRQAEVILANFFGELGWNVNVTWASPEKPAQPDE